METEQRQRASYLTPHDMRRLDWAVWPIRRKFTVFPVLVGSVLTTGDYRDIDIRLILPDEQIAAMTGGNQELRFLFDAAFTALIESMVRMPRPIDFQFQSETDAAAFDGPRNSLGGR